MKDGKDGSDWVMQELAGIDLGDKRRDRRARQVLDQWAGNPTASIPQACGGWAETMAAYRLCDNEEAAPDKILAPHRDATIQRIRQQALALLVQDTTELDFTGRAMEGLGPLGNGRRGMLLHPMIAVTPERLMLGVLNAQFRLRPEMPQSGKRKEAETENEAVERRRQTPIEQKESLRWLEGYRQACLVKEHTPETTIVCVADREGDIYECLEAYAKTPTHRRAHWLVRAAQDRRLEWSETPEGTARHNGGRLWEAARNAPVLGEVEFEVPEKKNRRRRRIDPDKPDRTARKVTQEIRALRVRLRPPLRLKGSAEPVDLHVVYAAEVDPPGGQEPICWLLITTLPVHTFEDACRVLDYYVCRWQIEVFFRVLKTGCSIEKKQFDNAERLIRCVPFYMIIAWRVLYVLMLGRAYPSLPASVIFEDQEWRAVYVIVKRKAPPEKAPPLGEFVPMLAKLGGHLGRKGDGPPGPKVTWTAIQRMRDFATAWDAFGPDAQKCV